MRSIILGSGMIARGIIRDLHAHGHRDIVLVDIDRRALMDICNDLNCHIPFHQKDARSLRRKDFEDFNICFSTLPYDFNLEVMGKAIVAKTHFIDLGGNNSVVQKQLSFSESAMRHGVVAVPDCGLAPGLASVLALRAIEKLHDGDTPCDIVVSVGGLPLRLDNPLNYHVCFSVHGLVNEYIEPVEILKRGRVEIVKPMTGLEATSIGQYHNLEHFYTSGGISTLPHFLEGSKQLSVEYKTLRYGGHCDLMNNMLSTFVKRDRAVFEGLLESSLPAAGEDMILIKVTGKMNDKLAYNFESITYGDREHDLSAMAKMTAYPTTIVAEMIMAGVLEPGVATIENVLPDNGIQLMLDGLAERGITFEERT